MKSICKVKWLGTLAALLFALVPQMRAQDADDLQEYLDQLAVQQTESQAQRPRRAQGIEIPVGLTEVDLSKFSYQNRTKTLTVKASVKFTNGIIAAASNYSGGTCLLKVYDGVTVVLDATASINAGAASSANCLAAVGIYGGSTFYECGDITAPDNGTGIAIYKDGPGGADGIFYHVSGTLKGSIYPPEERDAYAVLSTDKTTLSFYYDTQKSLRQGTIYTADQFRTFDNGWGDPSSSIITVTFDASFVDYNELTSTTYWFSNCSSLKTINGLANLNTSNVTNMNSMFSGCSGLTSLDLSSFNTGKVTNMSDMFHGCSGLTSLDLSGFNTSNVTYMGSMFNGCSGLTSLDLSNFNTSNVTTMNIMFDGCSGLTSLDLSNFNTSSVREMLGMFRGCSGLTSLDLSNFNTGKVTYMSTMFKDCSGLTSLDLSNFNTSKVQSMYEMFKGCSGLTSLDVSNFNTSNVTSMPSMFSDCRGLTSLDLSNFNTSNVTSMGSMFYGCSGLTSLDLSNFNTSNVTDMGFMFLNCRGLTSLDLSSFNTSNVTSMGGMFQNSEHLITITVGDGWNTDMVERSANMFKGCTSLVGGDGTTFDPNYTDKTKAYAGPGGYLTRPYSPDQLLALLNAIGAKLEQMQAMKEQAEAEYAKLDVDVLPENVRTYIEQRKATWQQYLQQYETLVAQYAALRQQVLAMTGTDNGTLYYQIVALQGAVYTGYNTMQVTIAEEIERIKAKAAEDLEQRLSELKVKFYQLSDISDGQETELRNMLGQVNDYRYFMLKDKDTHEFMQKMQVALNEVILVESLLTQFAANFNSLLDNPAIATFDDIVTYYTSYSPFVTQMEEIESRNDQAEALVAEIRALFATLEVNFPDESLAFTIRPTGLDKELQLGYKSNRGFVLTSAGMMWFEQKEGADFYLTDAEGNYIVATSGSTTLRAGTKAEATVWTGESIGDGNYTFYSKTTGRYLGWSGLNVNNAIIADTKQYSWTITESELDDLQAFLNLLAEEEETGGGDITEKDTLDIVIPDIDPNNPVPDKPFVFPNLPYPIRILPTPGGGYWPIPRPTPGMPCPADFHPYHIKKGSHVIIDYATFQDLVGGHHVIYVEGVLEININIYVYLTNWEWFIHVGPGGRVIWRTTGGEGTPRIKNEGTMDIEGDGLDYVDNSGTINHKHGTVNWIVNRYIYYFTGGFINLVHNYGTYNHNGGDVITAKNFKEGTYTMNGGRIWNTVVNSTETVFYNYGKFYFYSGLIGGYGSRLIYHDKGAVMWIDGGLFDFTYVKNYWIEAHADYYIRGNYDYGATVPVLLAPSVTIRILYKWIYKFNIVFIDGRPTPRYPLFWARDFKFDISYFKYIDWQLPNKRWRWYVDEEENTIEPRDEEVEDEDDLQAYLDWLAENQDGEAASTEENPQELDLKGRDIAITKPVVWPTGCHVYIKNGRFTPKTSWTYNYIFYIPATTTVRYEYITINVSSTTYYYLNGVPVQRNIFEVYGDFHFGTGCYVEGYVNTSWEPTDTKIPGAVIYIDPEARFFLDGGSFKNVIFRVNTVVNIYVTVTIVNNIYIYLPTNCRYEDFSFMAPWGGYSFTFNDLQKIVFWNSGSWGIRVLPSNGYMTLLDKILATPIASIASRTEVEVGTQVELSCTKEGATIYYTLDGSDPRFNTDASIAYDGTPITLDRNTIIKAVAIIPDMGESYVATFVYYTLFGDLNNDDKIDIADGVCVLDYMAKDGDNELGDLNADGEIDIADFVAILDIMAKDVSSKSE